MLRDVCQLLISYGVIVKNRQDQWIWAKQRMRHFFVRQLTRPPGDCAVDVLLHDPADGPLWGSVTFQRFALGYGDNTRYDDQQIRTQGIQLVSHVKES
ncbi:MAG: hypothetical protein WBO08_12785 [Mycobacterium sp.]|nr:hypothetical protein [Mycobacterium sp.]